MLSDLRLRRKTQQNLDEFNVKKREVHEVTYFPINSYVLAEYETQVPSNEEESEEEGFNEAITTHTTMEVKTIDTTLLTTSRGNWNYERS
jgi:hypothetical protein